MKYLYCIFTVFFLMLASAANAQNPGTMNKPFDAGVFSQCISANYYDHQPDMSIFNDNIGLPSKDAWYKFVLLDTLEISIDLCSSLVTVTHLYLLNDSYTLLGSNDNNGPICNSLRSSMKRTLPPGTYYAAMEGDGYGGPNDLVMTIRVVGQAIPIGAKIENPIDAGTFGNCSGRSFKDTRNNSSSCYGNEIGQLSNDIFYKFVVVETREIEISHCGSNFDTYIHLLNSSGAIIVSNDDYGPLCSGLQGSIKMTLEPGTYYVVSEGKGANSGNIITNIAVKPSPLHLGYSKDNPILAGEFSGCKASNYSDFTGNNICREFRGPVYYQLKILDDTDLIISSCYMTGMLKVMDLSGKTLAFSEDSWTRCSSYGVSLKTSLPAGVYIVEFLSYSNGGPIDITAVPRNPIGANLDNPIVVASLDPNIPFVSILDNSKCFGNEIGQISNDIYYKFKLGHTSEVTISHCGSTIDTYMHLLDSLGNVIQVNNDNGPVCSGTSASMIVTLPAGIYYVVSEGYGNASGNIITTISIPFPLGVIPLASNLSKSKNFIAIYTPREAFVKGTNLDQKNINEVMQNVQYFDGLGRLEQSIQTKGSADGRKDIVMPIVYDAFGRETRKYLPYASSDNYGGYKAGGQFNSINYYAAMPAGQAVGFNTPFSETRFEESPLNRVLERGAPGGSWQIGGGHTVKMSYETNSSGEVSIWETSATGASIAGPYAAGTLYKNRSTDENGHESIEYIDFLGKVILKKVNDGSGNYLSTYYIYDDLDNLRFVIPPKVTVTSFDENATEFKLLIYGYKYDGRKRLIKKKIPGKDWESLVYNQLDQLVYTQDANQKLNKQWSWIKYDALGRVILTGVENNNTLSSVDLQNNYINTLAAHLWEERTTSRADGYTIRTYPMAGEENANIVFHNVNYYDNYDFPGNLFGQPNSNFGQVSLERTRGLLTASKTRVLGTGDVLQTVNYYDEEGRVVQSKVQHYLGGIVSPGNYDEISNTNSFVGELKESIRKHYVGNSENLYVYNEYRYDHVGRKTETIQKTGDNSATLNPLILLSKNRYNEIGQLQYRGLHSTNFGLPSFAQTVEYKYNPRGWLSSQSAGLFSQRLKYDEILPGVVSQFNGNISRQEWGANNYYNYIYDDLNRLTVANSDEGNDEHITYDVMGNIKSLKRYSANSLVDQLNYDYANSNQLGSVTDINSNGSALFQLPGRTEYSYDLNGNMISRTNTGYTSNNLSNIAYNYLNLPHSMNANGTLINYTYDASGNKLKKAVSGVLTLNNEYIGGIHYEDGVLKFVSTEAGRVVRNDSTNYSYEYTLVDHLGNGRVYFDINEGVARSIQETNYYSFGLDIQKSLSGTENKYQYNGKEKQDQEKMFDYGARFYDPVIGRWNVVDPLSESDRKTSPYTYVFNNPLRFIDPTGMKGESTHTDLFGNVLAIYDDGDLGVYKHKNGTKENIDGLYRSNPGTSGGGEQMGETWTPFGFADFGYFEKHGVAGDGSVKVAAGARIDFNSSFATDEARAIVKANPSAYEYSKKAGSGGDWDIKSHTPNGNPYFGSLLWDKYASARDAGNIAAGIVADRSSFPTVLIDYGFGLYNQSGNNKKIAVAKGYGDSVLGTASPILGLGNFLRRAFTGEDKLTRYGINTGKKVFH